MADQLREDKKSVLTKILNGNITNMKQFWNAVSDDDSKIKSKNRKTFDTRGDPFSREQCLSQNITNKMERYINLTEAKNNGQDSKSLSEDIVNDTNLKYQQGWEKGNTKEQSSFWEGISQKTIHGHVTNPDRHFYGN